MQIYADPTLTLAPCQGPFLNLPYARAPCWTLMRCMRQTRPTGACQSLKPEPEPVHEPEPVPEPEPEPAA